MARWRAAPSARSAAAPARPARWAPSTTCFPRSPPPRGASTPSRRACRNTGERDGFRGVFTTARLGWTPVEGTRIEGLLRWRQTNFGLDDVPRDDPNYSAEDRRWYGQLRGETRLFDGIWTTGLRARRDRGPAALREPARRAEPRHRRRPLRRHAHDARLGQHGPPAGASARCRTARSASASPIASRSRGAPADRPSSARPWTRTSTPRPATPPCSTGLLERLDMTAGLRHDATTGFTDETTWRLGAALALPEIASRLRASGGTAFAAPSLFQRFGVIGSFFRGNPDLRPERSIGWEVGAETDFPAFGRAAFATTSRHLLPEPHPRPDQFRRRLPDADQRRPRAHPGRGARPDPAPCRMVRDDGGVDDHRRLRRRDGPPIAAPAGARGERHRAHRAGAARGDRTDPALHRPQPGRRLRQLQQRGRRLTLTRGAIRRARW